MKTIKNIISALLLILSYSFSQAQQADFTPQDELQDHKNAFKAANYAFEGKVIKQIRFQKNHEVLFGYILQITKIYKGSPVIKLGTIKIIQRTGGYESYTLADGTTAVGSGTQDFTPILLSTGYSYIVFADQGYSNLLDTVPTDNSINFTMMTDPILLRKININWGLYSKFPTIDSLYSFMKENGATVQEETEEKK